MSVKVPAKPVYPVRTFEFNGPKPLIDFLDTTQAEAEMRPGSNLYDQALNRLYLLQPKTLYIRVQAHQDLIARLEAMAQSSMGGKQGRIHEDDVVPDDAVELNIERLLRMLALKPAKSGRLTGSLLLALWGATPGTLCEVAANLWNLGASGLELAFLQSSSRQSTPTHLIRVHGLRHVDALRSWVASEKDTLEIYQRTGRSLGNTEYYILADYQFPVPSPDRLLQIRAEMVLIRPGRESKTPEWLTFSAGEVRFFRKPHEILDLQASFRERPLLEAAADEPPQPIPLSLAIIPKPRGADRQYWQIDQELDRCRRTLRELEQKRARLVGRDRDEVYFAYRFHQAAEGVLNPLLVRLMQQRLGTLSGYDHAYCQPKEGKPFHLVLANRPCRALGFALQMADRIYYQPKQWRNWGVNLYLPLDTELAPLIDSHDAIPLLQQVLDNTSKLRDDEQDAGDYREWEAILWEPDQNGVIYETRVKQKRPLLAQFRLLNSFQAQVARDVDAQTRQRLADALHATRIKLTDNLQEVERDILAYAAREADRIEADFADMHVQLSKADQLMTQLKPQVDEVCSRLLQAPQNWLDFVNLVIRTHRELTQPAVDEFQQTRSVIVAIQTTLLKTLTPRGRNLVEAAQKGVAHLQQRLLEFDQLKDGMLAHFTELEQLGSRAAAVLAEVQRTADQIGDRLQAVREAEKQITTMQREIAEIHERETVVREQHEHVRKQRAEAEIVAAETDKRQADIRESEDKVIQLTAELGRLKLELNRRGALASARMGQLAQQLVEVRRQSESMQQLSKEINEQVGFVDRHSEAVTLWQNHRLSWESALNKKCQELSETIGKMEHVLSQTRQRSSELDQLGYDVSSLRSRIESLKYQGNGDEHG
ncbi:MAG: hypothetical protein AABP62_25240 [Planctomycetota bacterium]